LDAYRDSGPGSRALARDQPDRKCEVHQAGGSFSLSRCGRVGGDTALGRNAPAGLGSTASSLPRLDLAFAGVDCFDDAGGEVAPGILENDAGLGFLSAVFDNIPLTALALKQDSYDWGMLAYAVGFSGSMIWFGSSAGVAISNLFPEVRSVGAWVKEGWLTAVAYVVGFVVLLMLLGWHPAPKLRPKHRPPDDGITQVNNR